MHRIRERINNNMQALPITITKLGYVRFPIRFLLTLQHEFGNANTKFHGENMNNTTCLNTSKLRQPSQATDKLTVGGTSDVF